MIQSEAPFIRPEIFLPYDQLFAAESTRHAGNLGLYTTDEPGRVARNRLRFFQGLSFSPGRVAGLHQVHGHNVLHADAPGQYPGYDALISRTRDLLLTITIADCVPVLIWDPVREAIGAVHAGWRGTRSGIVNRTIESMTGAFGSDPRDCMAYIGTCIDGDSYEVDEDVAGYFAPAFKRWNEKKEKYYLDLKEANFHQLVTAGLPETRIGISTRSTVKNNSDYFSYRKEKGNTGRMLAVIGLR